MQLGIGHQEGVPVRWAETDIVLHPDRSIWIEDDRVLLISDLHLGKANHFRKSGIGVPLASGEETLNRLDRLCNLYQPTRVMILGDLFHSIYNSSWDRFINFLRARPAYRFTLVHGNHDILSREKYLEAGIELVGEEYVMGKLLLSHYPKEDLEASQYNMAGHIHPSVRLRGRGRQGLRVPCFLFKERSAVLPAFGAFTGMARVEIKKTDRVYGLVNRRVIPLHEAQ